MNSALMSRVARLALVAVTVVGTMAAVMFEGGVAQAQTQTLTTPPSPVQPINKAPAAVIVSSSSSSPFSAIVGTAIKPVTFSASGGPAGSTYTWGLGSGSNSVQEGLTSKSTGLPQGLTALVNGSDHLVISGTPMVTTTQTLTITASAGLGQAAPSGATSFEFVISKAASSGSVAGLATVGSGSTAKQDVTTSGATSSYSSTDPCTVDSTGSSGTCGLTTPNGTYSFNYGSITYTYDPTTQVLSIEMPDGFPTYSPTTQPAAVLCTSVTSEIGGLDQPANYCNPQNSGYETPLTTSNGLDYQFSVPIGDYWFLHVNALEQTLVTASPDPVANVPTITKSETLGSKTSTSNINFYPTGSSTTTTTTAGSYTVTPGSATLAAGQSVVVTDPLPTNDGIVYTSYTVSGADASVTVTGCSTSTTVPGTIKCTYTNDTSSTLKSVSLGTIVIDFTVPNTAVTTSSTITNTATISYKGGTPVNSNTVTITLVPVPVSRVIVVSVPSLLLRKVEAPGSVDPITKVGQTIAYDFVVTNTGGTTLNHLVVSDIQSVPGETLNAPISCPATSLAAGASVTCTGSYTVTSTDITNAKVTDTAVATATTSTGTKVTSDPSTLTIPVSVPTTSAKTVTPKTTTKTVTPITKSSSTAPTPVKLVTGPPAPPASSTNALPLGAGIAGLGIAGLGYLVIERKRNNQHGSTDEVA